MVNCKLLWQELLITQLANITKKLNLSGCEKEVLELRLRQGLLQAGCVKKKIS
ncbi:17008_t:CDS:1, partial [Gigaspora margarita]